MTHPSGLRRDEAPTIAQQFGVELEQVHRDHLISAILAALQTHADDLIFFGGTALARTLVGHPRLLLSPVKEPKFFLCDGAPQTRSRQRGPGDAHSAREWVWRESDRGPFTEESQDHISVYEVTAAPGG